MAAASNANDLLYDVRDGIGLVTINRPQARNALTFPMYTRLVEIFSGVPTDGSIKAIVVTGAGGKAFAAGTDISEFRAFEKPEQGLEYERTNDLTFQALEACPVPTIAAIAGACTGGGAGIAACCDLRIAAKDARFGFPIARTLGNMLSAATLGRLVALMGQARVVDLVFSARLIGAEEAHRIGLYNEVVADHAAALARAMELARTLAGHAPLTMRATKELLRRMRQAGAEVDDRDLVARIYTSADFREGLDAFLTKRPPRWRGR